MVSTAKNFIRTAFRRLGFELVRAVPADRAAGIDAQATSLEQQYRHCREALAVCQAVREIHRQDAIEIEELYRQFVFAGLPSRKGREILLNDLIGTTISEAIYIVSSLHESLQNPGDICEFGVAQGATSRLLAFEIESLPERNLWLFDSFEGLPAPSREDKLINDIFNLGSMDRYKGTMASPESEVLSKLAAIRFPSDRTRIKKGWVKDSIRSGDLPAKVAFAYVDFDFYDPIKDTLEFLDSRMAPGSKIVVDDYGFFSEGAQLAVDQFVASTAPRYKFELPLPFAGHFCILSKLA